MARERYLLDDGEEQIHSNVITSFTKKEKIQNWWFYNKKLLLLWIVLGIAVVSIVCSFVFKVYPDYTIAIMNEVLLDTKSLKLAEEEIAKYGEDLNGDGKVIVTLANYAVAVDSGDSGYDASSQQAATTKFVADMSTGDSMIWMHDGVGYYCMSDQDGLFEEIETDKKLSDKLMIPWGDIKGLNDIDFSGFEHAIFTPENMKEIFSTLRVSIRKVEGSTIERSKKLIAYHDNSQKLLNNLMSGTKTVVE